MKTILVLFACAGAVYGQYPASASGSTTAAAEINGKASVNYAAGGGTAQAQTATFSPAATSLVDGLPFCWLPAAANTAAAPTFSPNGLTAHSVVKRGGAALAANDIITTAHACVIYNLTNTNWELQNPQTTAGTYRSCDIPIGDTSGSALTSGQLGPQSRVCFIPAASTIVEMDVNADSGAGTPSIIVGRNRAGTIVNIVSSALATAATGGIACSNTGGTTGLNGATTCSSTLQNTGLNAGDYLELVSGTVVTAKFFVVHVVYTVN